MKYVCQGTHRFLASGTCPWCQEGVVGGQLRPDVPRRGLADRRWDIGAMLEALNCEDADVRQMVVTNVAPPHAPLDQALPVLRKALANAEVRVPWLAMTFLERHGCKLGREDAERYEQAVQAAPDDSALHLLLMAYYALPSHLLPSARQALHRHALWVIEHAPEVATVRSASLPLGLDPASDGAAYEQAKRLWQRRLEADPGNAILLGNAAQFFLHCERDRSEALLRQAQALEPQNPDWGERLAHIHSLKAQGLTDEARRETAVAAFAELEKSYALQPGELQRWLMLPELAKAAFEAGALEKARGYATEMLRGAAQPDYFHHQNGAAVHYGNLVLGRLALQAGDVAGAKAHLLESGKTRGSPVLCTGGPNMTLAKELLERGEREAVVQFLHLCTNFWKSRDHRAEQWAYAIQQGQVPDFGANLYY